MKVQKLNIYLSCTQGLYTNLGPKVSKNIGFEELVVQKLYNKLNKATANFVKLNERNYGKGFGKFVS